MTTRHAEQIEMILHDIHEAHDVHYTPMGALVEVVYAHLPIDTGIAPTDIHTAVWAWRLSNRVCTLVDDSGNAVYRPLLWYMTVVHGSTRNPIIGGLTVI